MLKTAIQSASFYQPVCPVYQNVVARAVMDAEEIKQNLINQLTGPVKWTQTIQAMVADGATQFTEVGPGKVLQGLIQKISKDPVVASVG
jgi:[acyl-carrier-protein] S-malonyltransferase